MKQHCCPHNVIRMEAQITPQNNTMFLHMPVLKWTPNSISHLQAQAWVNSFGLTTLLLICGFEVSCICVLHWHLCIVLCLCGALSGLLYIYVFCIVSLYICTLYCIFLTCSISSGFVTIWICRMKMKYNTIQYNTMLQLARYERLDSCLSNGFWCKVL
jgi:hypothetical protein